jgi:hypothetical protein
MRHARRLSTFLFALSLFACEGDDKKKQGGDDTQSPVNQAPTADAFGPTEVLVGDTVTLDASKSSDADGDELKFLWTEDENNPPNNALDGIELTDSKLVFRAIEDGTFTYHVRVRDGKLAEDNAKVTIKVIRNTVKPVLTVVRASSKSSFADFQEFSAGSAPAVFTTATGVVYLQGAGTDEDSDATSLTVKFSANAPDGVVNVADSYDPTVDDDGFGTIPVEVWVEDLDGLSSVKQTIEVRVVPQANANLYPKAFFVDCSAVGGQGTMIKPFGTIQAGYDAAVTSGADVYVAIGTCQEDTIQVDFDGISLYGLFVPEETWRRRTEPSDKQVDLLAANGQKFAVATTIRNPNAVVLVQGPQTGMAGASLSFDGFAFELTGANNYAVSLTSTAGTAGTKGDLRLRLINNSFSGFVTNVASVANPGGVKITADEYSGAFHMLRNLFAVSAAGGNNYFQLWMEPKVTTRAAGTNVSFVSNVFYGSIGATSSCDYYGGFYFAFCLYQTNSSNHKGTGFIERNSFYLRQVPDLGAVRPIILDGGRGELHSIGNFFTAPPDQNAVIFIKIRDPDGSGNSNVKSLTYYNAFPATNSNFTMVRIGNSAKDYKCTNGTSFFENLDCTGGTDANIPALGSFSYDLVETFGSQEWRKGVSEVHTYTLKPQSAWDFDGRYGAGDDDSSSSNEYNAGAFEPAASLY